MSVTTLPFRRCSVWLLLAFAFSIRARAAEPDPILLWPNGAPGSEAKNAQESLRISPQGDHVVSSVHRPSITLYLPSKENATGAVVIVIPGGGHRELWMDHEGYRVGRWLSEHGIAAFVLKYRLAAEPGSSYTIEGHSFRMCNARFAWYGTVLGSGALRRTALESSVFPRGESWQRERARITTRATLERVTRLIARVRGRLFRR